MERGRAVIVESRHKHRPGLIGKILGRLADRRESKWRVLAPIAAGTPLPLGFSPAPSEPPDATPLVRIRSGSRGCAADRSQWRALSRTRGPVAAALRRRTIVAAGVR